MPDPKLYPQGSRFFAAEDIETSPTEADLIETYDAASYVRKAISVADLLAGVGVVRSVRMRLTIAQVNAGATLVAAPGAGYALRLVDAGCRVVMPLASPIGSARGITNRDALKLLRQRLPDITLVVDAGLGAPSHAAQALELGYDAVLLNTAIAKAADPVAMAKAFRLGVEAGRTAYEAGLMDARDFASPSTPVVGTPFWHAVS